jgi:hypothetical protein
VNNFAYWMNNISNDFSSERFDNRGSKSRMHRTFHARSPDRLEGQVLSICIQT